MKTGVALLFAALTLVAAAQEQDRRPLTGVIRGTVLDELERPLQGAKIRADLISVAVRTGALRYVESNVDGNFIIDNLELGSYFVYGTKEPEGYAQTDFAFYSDRSPMQVKVSPADPIATVTLKLGPKAAVLSGSVRDAVTGKPIPAGFLIRRTATPERWISLSQPSRFRVLIPPATDVTVEISSAGYKSQVLGAADSQPLQLAAGSEMDVDVQLEPTPEPMK